MFNKLKVDQFLMDRAARTKVILAPIIHQGEGDIGPRLGELPTTHQAWNKRVSGATIPKVMAPLLKGVGFQAFNRNRSSRFFTHCKKSGGSVFPKRVQKFGTNLPMGTALYFETPARPAGAISL